MEYILKLKSGKNIPLWFSNGSAELFCKKNGNISVSELMEKFTTGLSFGSIISLLLSTAEYHAGKHKKPFDFTEYDADDWMGEMGGMTGEQTKDALQAFFNTLFPQHQGMAVNGEESEEKKITVGTTTESTVLEAV